jgi:hypothetical protein
VAARRGLTELDLDGEIVAALVSGLGERAVCLRLGCTIGRVRAVFDERRALVFASENVALMRPEAWRRSTPSLAKTNDQ